MEASPLGRSPFVVTAAEADVGFLSRLGREEVYRLRSFGSKPVPPPLDEVLLL